MKPLVAVDFETKAIGPRPKRYPPVPVGVAITLPRAGKLVSSYDAWGHPTGNNSTRERARLKLKELYQTHTVVFHNSAFDCEVGREHLGLAFPTDFEDTLFQGFLWNPRALELSLKPLAEEVLNIKPKERDRLRDWILKHVPNATEKDWGAYISEAPGDLVSPYAIGDTERTLKLFLKFREILEARDRRYPPGEGQQSLADAYMREKRLMPVIVKMEARGVRVDVRRLKRDVPKWRREAADLDKYLITKLGGMKQVMKYAKKGELFNIGSKQQLANAMDAAKLVTHWKLTPKGKRSTAKGNLAEVIKDKKFAEALARRELLLKYVSTYGEKWLELNTDGFVFPRINQVRNRENDAERMGGARTGRLSYSDSWQAIPAPDRRPYPDLPNLRDYVVPDDGESVIAVRDYSQQEFRILAHYEAGPLLERYQENPEIDMHDAAKDMIHEITGMEFERRPVKDTGFGLIYGMGIPKLALKAKIDDDTAKILRDAYLKAIPGLKALQAELKSRAKRDEPIRTWGGRLYWVEEPRIIRGRLWTFDYKLLNILVQGSAADNTKEAMIRADAALDSRAARLMLQVHDELALSALKARLKKSMATLREAMESVEFDVKMLSDGKWSARSWGSLKKFKEV